MLYLPHHSSSFFFPLLPLFFFFFQSSGHHRDLHSFPTRRSSDLALDFRQIWGGISGARVGRVAVGQSEPLIWKEGDERKIDEEIREMDAWNRIVPGLVPDVKARHREDGRLSFLGQFLRGSLLRDVYITRSWDEKVRATQRLLETVRDIWSATLVKEPPRIDYARQIRDRLPELFALHPKLESLRGGESRRSEEHTSELQSPY